MSTKTVLEEVSTAQGKGEKTYADGDVYEGDWKGGKKHGKGKLSDAGGNVYEGDWKRGKKHGRGKKTYADKRVYEGDWKDDRFHGKGRALRKTPANPDRLTLLFSTVSLNDRRPPVVTHQKLASVLHNKGRRYLD